MVVSIDLILLILILFECRKRQNVFQVEQHMISSLDLFSDIDIVPMILICLQCVEMMRLRNFNPMEVDMAVPTFDKNMGMIHQSSLV